MKKTLFLAAALVLLTGCPGEKGEDLGDAAEKAGESLEESAQGDKDLHDSGEPLGDQLRKLSE